MASSMALGLVVSSKKEGESGGHTAIKPKCHAAAGGRSSDEFLSAFDDRTTWKHWSDTKMRVRLDGFHEEPHASNVSTAADEPILHPIAEADNAIVVVNEADDDSVSDRKEEQFVNVMSKSWLLSSMAQRTMQARGPDCNGSSLGSLDPRTVTLDLLFVFRSGQRGNLLGRPPAPLPGRRAAFKDRAV